MSLPPICQLAGNSCQTRAESESRLSGQTVSLCKKTGEGAQALNLHVRALLCAPGAVSTSQDLTVLLHCSTDFAFKPHPRQSVAWPGSCKLLKISRRQEAKQCDLNSTGMKEPVRANPPQRKMKALLSLQPTFQVVKHFA